jgi:hypothetical protein
VRLVAPRAVADIDDGVIADTDRAATCSAGTGNGITAEPIPYDGGRRCERNHRAVRASSQSPLAIESTAASASSTLGSGSHSRPLRSRK